MGRLVGVGRGCCMGGDGSVSFRFGVFLVCLAGCGRGKGCLG